MAAGRVLGAGAPRVRGRTGPLREAAIAELEFRVVRGHPTDEETAALAVVLAAKLAARSAEDRARARSPAGGWADRARALHVLPAPGPGAWKSSARPG